jgi:hypothetical protein
VFAVSRACRYPHSSEDGCDTEGNIGTCVSCLVYEFEKQRRAHTTTASNGQVLIVGTGAGGKMLWVGGLASS